MTSPTPAPREHTLSRRPLLKTMAGPAAPRDPQAATLAYLQSLRRGDAFGWDDQDEPQLTATFAVIGAYQCLTGKAPADPAKIAAFVRADHPQKGASQLRVFDYQQVQ